MRAPPRLSPYRAASRTELLADLRRRFAERTAEAPQAGRQRGLDERTLALLDACATVTAIVDFYQERIAAEGYLETAVEPGSILALATLVGYRPRPGLAATVHLAYSLNADPADTAVALPAGLLSMSVPGEGEEPQTFESAEELVARPSWNVLTPLSSTPLTVTPDGVGRLDRLVVRGLDPQLQPNDVILLDVAGGDPPLVVRVAEAHADPVAQTTTVSLQAGAPAPPPPAPAEPPSLVDALEQLAAPLRRRRPPRVARSHAE